jgi:tetratricopeptide (TPR) repeat protein
LGKVARNDPCPCGSGKKFKRCHGAGARSVTVREPVDVNQLVLRGLRLQQSGDLDQAEQLYRKALESAPAHPDALHLLGLLNYQRRNSREAVKLIEKAIAVRPGVAEFHNNCGEAYRELGKYAEAIAQYNRALELSPDFVEAMVNRGVAQRLAGHFEASEQSYRSAISRHPELQQARINLGNLLRAQSRFTEAEVEYKQALGGVRTDAQVYNDLGVILLKQRDGTHALEYLNRAREMDSHNAELLSNIGMAHELMLQLPIAAEMYRQALTLKPDSAPICRNLGLALYGLRELRQSVAVYRQALQIAPEDADTRINLAYSLFSLGDLEDAWKEYDRRTQPSGEVSRSQAFDAREWRGEDLTGKSLLVWGEQGIGDQVWLASLLPDLVNRLGSKGKLVFECAPKLQVLLQRSFPQVTVVAVQNPPHIATKDVSFQVAAGKLGGYLRSSFDDFHQLPAYLFADTARVEFWRSKLAALGPGLKVGICWRSNNSSGRRAEFVTAIADWIDILRVPGVEFVNLQYDECAKELALAKELTGVPIRHFGELDMFDDLDETSALMTALDLVISTPTAVSLLATALGVPTWQLNYIEDWRAFGRDSNPWFPSLRSWNRPWDETWPQVLTRVALALEELAGGRSDETRAAAAATDAARV